MLYSSACGGDADHADAGSPAAYSGDDGASCGACSADYPCLTSDAGYTCRGQFSDWPPNFDVAMFQRNGDGTLSDARTGLVWQAVSDSGTYAWDDAKRYCDDLSLAGGAWRLPSEAELESILDDVRSAPALDPTLFPASAGAWSWSSSSYVGSSDTAWGVDFGEGFSDSASVDDMKGVRCVRGGASGVVSSGSGDAPPGRYTIDHGTVYDNQTKLTWQQTLEENAYTLGDATSYCASLTLAGGGFRMPTRAELLSLVDRAKYEPAIDRAAFPNTPSAPFWSSSTFVATPTTNWFVSFVDGASLNFDPSRLNHVRCVR
ncbi:MAG TPA: DUF1566 domain-containing protein [Polyangiales bacterium]